MRVFLFIFLFPIMVLGECFPKEGELQKQLVVQVRGLYGLDAEREVQLVEKITDDSIPKKEEVALLEFISEDRLFNQPRSDGPCPDRIIRLYKVYTHDEFRRCNGILRAEVMSGVYDLLYSNCGTN